MNRQETKKPGDLLVAKPASFDGSHGVAIFADCSWVLSDGELRKDERFICGLAPAEGDAIEDTVEHIARAILWLKANPEDPRVAEIEPPVDQIYYRERRVWHAVRETAGSDTRILVSKRVQVWKPLDEVEYLDEPWMRETSTEKEDLDKRDAWIRDHADDEDECDCHEEDEDEDDSDNEKGYADGAYPAENSHERSKHAENGAGQ